MSELTFVKFQEVNSIRCVKGFKSTIDEWNPMEWACALSGEVGELCNLLKKRYGRGEKIPMEQIADEVADVFIYLDLLATHLRLDMETVIKTKFNKTSKKVGVPEITV
jgi:NTP pyrophosphatase (non-canonical NTP hydrolase)